jgi:hypothetical protein
MSTGEKNIKTRYKEHGFHIFSSADRSKYSLCSPLYFKGLSIQQSTTIAHGSNALLPGSCDFDHSACNYTGSSHNVYWVRQTGTGGSGRVAILGDHSIDGN